MHALTVVVPAAAVDAMSDALSDELGALAVSIADADAGSAAEEPVFDEPATPTSAPWRRASVDALFADERAALGAAATLAARHGEWGTTIESIREVGEHDWVRITQAQFTPVEVAPGFWVVPTWADAPAGARHVVRLDPGLAFGTGTHPTTQMCLRWIARGVPAAGRVLDYGCGSGILAIAAARLGGAKVDAVDIDPVAVATTRANALANGVAVCAGTAETATGTYALVVANILAAPLKLLAPLLASFVAEDGELLLSGVLERQAKELARVYAPWLELAVADRDDGWVLLVGKRRTDRVA